MRYARVIAIVLLAGLLSMCLLAEVVVHDSYSRQLRELPDAAPSHQHLLGTDDLGRDRFSRLLYGTRVSLLLAPAAALLSSVLAALIGGIGGVMGGWLETVVVGTTDLFLSMPWFFLLLTLRALLPLNVSPLRSVTITFALLGLLGWAAAARVICANARSLRHSDFVLLARASGTSGLRLLFRHLIPNLKPVLYAQFWISVPVFILTEANLGVLGLGVAEPLPSWGSLLRELEGFTALPTQPWLLAPLILLIITVSCFHIAMQSVEEWA